MTTRVEVPPTMIAWARDRSGVSEETLRTRFPKLAEWETGESSPTFKQLERFARATFALDLVGSLELTTAVAVAAQRIRRRFPSMSSVGTRSRAGKKR